MSERDLPAASEVVTATTAPGSGRTCPLDFGWRMPMWDPNGAPARSWLPAVHANLNALRGRFETIWLSDHFVPGSTWMPPEPDTMECWTASSYFAGAFPSYRYGQIVLGNSYRHPPLLAKMAATLQLLSGGKLILGIGAGWMESEYRAYGYDYPSNAVRLRQLDEAVQIIRRMWSGSPASFAGRYYRIEQAYCNPPPDPAPTILIGAQGEQLGLRLVARHADSWNLSGASPDNFTRKARLLEQHCEVVGRDPTSILYNLQCQSVRLADSEREAHRLAEGAKLYQETAPDARLVGTPEQVAARLEEYVSVGVRQFILRFLDFPSTEGAERFAAEVAPRLRARFEPPEQQAAPDPQSSQR